MSQNTTFKFQEKRSGEVLNRRWRDILPPGKYKGFFVTANGTNLILSISTTDPDTLVDFETNVLLTSEGVRIEETTDLNGIIVLAPADPTLARIDRIVTKHKFDATNTPAVHTVIQGVPDAAPVPPPIPDDGFTYTELAQVTIGAAATSVDQTDVTNLGLQTVGLSNVGLADLSDVSADEAAAFNAMTNPSGANPIVTQSVLDAAVSGIEATLENWKVTQQDPVSDSVDVSDGRAHDPLLETSAVVAAGPVGPFDPVPSGGDVRIDLIVVDQLTQAFAIRQGAVNGDAGAPTSDDYPVARILVTETAAGAGVLVETADITDVKPVFWRPDPKVTGLRYGDDSKVAQGVMDALQAAEADPTNPPTAANPIATVDGVQQAGHGDLTADLTPYHSAQSVAYDPETIFEALDDGADLVTTNLIQDPDALFQTIGIKPGDNLKVTTGTQTGVYEVDAVNSQTELALLNSAGLDPGLSNEVGVSYEVYRIWDTGPENMNQVAGELANRVTVLDALKPGVIDLGSFAAGTIAITKQASYVQAEVTANGVNVGAPEQLADGAHMFIAIKSDSGGPRTITWDPSYNHEPSTDQLLTIAVDYTVWMIIRNGIALVAIRLNNAAGIPIEQGSVFSAGSGQTFIVPGGTTLITAVIWGGGGGGGHRFSILGLDVPGSGGGGTGFIRAIDLPVTPGESIDVDVGAGGNGGASNGAAGSGGQQSRVESTTNAWELISGGGGGAGAASGPPGGGGSTTVNGISPGGGWTQENGVAGLNDINGVISGAGGDAGGLGFGGGTGGAGVSFGGPGNPGNPFGAGGSGGFEDFTSSPGGPGADGRVIIIPQN
jgi:hypothetical protein